MDRSEAMYGLGMDFRLMADENLFNQLIMVHFVGGNAMHVAFFWV